MIAVKLGKSNCGPDHLSRIDSGEDPQSIKETILDMQLFRLQHTPSYLEEISVFRKEGVAPKGIKTLEKKQLAIRVASYMLISGDLYKLRHDEVLHKSVLEHENLAIIEEAHGGSSGRHYVGDTTARKILMACLWQETFYKD